MQAPRLVERVGPVVARHWPTLAAVAFGAVVAAVVGPIHQGDTRSYLVGTPMRPPLLPLLLGAARAFGPVREHAVVFVQAALGLLGCIALAREIRQTYGGGATTFGVAIAALLLPLLQYCSHLMSEALSYAFVCLTIAAGLAMLRGADLVTSFARFIASLTLLLLVRAQFLYLLPAVPLLLSWLLFRTRGARSRWYLTATVLIGAGILCGTQALYSVSRSGGVHRISATGIQLLTVVAFNSTPADLASVSDPLERAYARAVLEEMRGNRLGYADRPFGVVRQMHFAVAYNLLCWNIVVGQFDRLYGSPTPALAQRGHMQDRPRDWVTMERVTTTVSAQLLRSAWPRFVRHVVECVYQIHKYYLFVVVGALVLPGVQFARGRGTPPASALGIVALLWLVNVGVVAAVEYPMTRYTFYFDSPLLAVVLVLVVSALQRHNQDTEKAA